MGSGRARNSATFHPHSRCLIGTLNAYSADDSTATGTHDASGQSLSAAVSRRLHSPIRLSLLLSAFDPASASSCLDRFEASSEGSSDSVLRQRSISHDHKAVSRREMSGITQFVQRAYRLSGKAGSLRMFRCI
jgi:hypothetical protein